jgi:2-phosphoglycolate phosphatase
MNFRALIFDLDGTLVDSYPGIQQSLNETLQHFGRPPVDIETVKRMVGRGVENLMQQAIADRWREAVPIFRKSYDETHLEGTFLFDDVISTLKILQSHGIPMSVASNKPPDFTRNILRHLKLDPYFVECFGPNAEIPAKPNRAMLQTAMAKMNSSVADTVYVGDMVLDVETARNAGVRVALIPTGGNSVEELRAANPDYLLRNFSDLVHR